MPTTEKWLRSTTEESLLTTGLNSLANNGLAVSGAITITDSGHELADATLVVTFTVAPTANTGVAVWFLRETDGTNYEDGDASTTPARLPDVTFPLRAVTTLQRIVRPCILPPGPFKALLRNDGTGQAFSASGNTLKLKPFTPQGT